MQYPGREICLSRAVYGFAERCCLAGGLQLEAEGVLGGWKGLHFRHSGSISL